MFEVLDVILGLVFVYLMLSLVASAANEVIAQLFNSRAAILERGIRTLFTAAGSLPSSIEEALARRAAASTALDKAIVAAGDEQTFRDWTAAEATAAEATRKLADANAAERDARKARQIAEATLAAVATSGSQVAIGTAQNSLIAADTALAARQAAVVVERKAYDHGVAARDAASAAFTKASGDLAREVKLAKAEYEEARAAATAADLYQHPLIAGLSQVRWTRNGRIRSPSYIPPRAFANALLDIVAPTSPVGPKTVGEIRRLAEELPSALRRPLLVMADEAGSDLERLRTSIESWYEDAMERVSGLYKRKTQVVILSIAAVMTVSLNADTIRIGRALASNSTLRETITSQAEALAANPSEDIRQLIRLDSIRRALPPDTPDAPETAAGATADTADTTVLAVPAEDSVRAFRVAQLRSMVDSVQELGIPLGWNAPPAPGDAGVTEKLWHWISFHGVAVFFAAPGLLLTTLAVSLGAPFWFDMLNKLINMRAAGRAPEEKPKS